MPETTVFVPCLMNHLYPETAQNLVSILKQFNCQIDFQEQQGCCGLPFLQKGDQASAKLIAEKFLNDFQTGKHDHHTLIPSGPCTMMVKEYYPRIFNNTVSHLVCNKVVEGTAYVFDYIADKLINNLNYQKVSGRYFLHTDCQYKQASVELLVSKLSNIEWLRPAFTESCCGAAGAMGAHAHKLSGSLNKTLTDDVLASGASQVVVCDDSCRASLDNYIQIHKLPLSTIHLIDLLAQAL